MLEETAHVLVAVFVLHHAQRGVFRQAFGHHVRALLHTAHQLVPPPLVRQLMCGYKPGEIDIVRTLQPTDKADALRVGNGIGKRLRKAAVARKLDDAELVELIGAIIPGVVIQTGLGRANHLIQIVSVRGQIIDLQIHAVPLIAFHRVATGDVTEKVLNACRTHAVFKVTASILLPLPRKIAGRDSNLVRRSADHRVIGNKVRVRAEEVCVHAIGIATVWQFFQLTQTLLPAAHRVIQLAALIVTKRRKVIAVKESAVVRKLRLLVGVAESRIVVGARKANLNAFPRRNRGCQVIDPEAVIGVGSRCCRGAIEADALDRAMTVGHVNILDGLAALIDSRVSAGGAEAAAFRKDVDHGIDGDDLGNRRTLIFLIELFVLGLEFAAVLVGEKWVEHVRVVVEPGSAAAR